MDFSERLKSAIVALNLPIPTKIGVPGTSEGAWLYPVPGGQVTREYMDGDKDEDLTYEYVIKSKNAEAASEQLGRVSEFLERLSVLDSHDNSFIFNQIKITSKPAQSQADEQGFFYWGVDFTATLTTR